MAFIEIKNLYKCFQKVVAVNRIHLEVDRGEMLTLLGPSGCGKTTTLRCIAGLETPEEGDIVIDGKSVLSPTVVPSARRGIGMVFQNYAVWPHMKVYNNVVYGLKLQGISREEIRKSARQVLNLVGLEGLEGRYPSQLSGGQQQRVALARALVRNPKVLLLDEPLSNLDAKLREKMRFEIKSLVQRMGITSVYVTHDQAEAMVISDRIAVMHSGDVVQVGTPHQIYKEPVNRFVADFIGTMNFLPGEVRQMLPDREAAVVRTEFGEDVLCRVTDFDRIKTGRTVYASIRPEDVEVQPKATAPKENLFTGTLVQQAYLGNFLTLFINLDGSMIRAQVPHHLPLQEGAEIAVHLNPQKCTVLI